MNRSQTRALGLGIVTLCALVAYLFFRSAPPAQVAAPSTVVTTTTSTDSRHPPADALPANAGPQPTTNGTVEPDGPSELPRYRGPVRNAEQAALIREALIARKAVQTGTMPEPQGTGNQIDKPLGEYVARTMREQFLPLAGECYEALLGTQPNAAGNVALEFSVLGDPSVGGVVVDVTLGKETTLRNEEFRTCMSESMYAVVFDAPPGKDGSVSVKQSFELSP